MARVRSGGMAMERDEDRGWYDADTFETWPTEPRRYWAEQSACDVGGDEILAQPLLFAERGAEAELRKEMRLSQLWGLCRARAGACTMEDFRELSGLIAEVNGIRGALCIDCAMLDRPNVSSNWSLGNTTLCRGHLRFRLGHTRIEDSGSQRSS